jgi:hypothetical protein
VILAASCSLQYIDAPSLDQEDRWIKEALNKKDIARYLANCGYDEPTWSIAQQERVDSCMLLQGFIFIDSPYGRQGSRCKHPMYQTLPSCQSLKNQKNNS